MTQWTRMQRKTSRDHGMGPKEVEDVAQEPPKWKGHLNE